jgi:hypothetical protein
MTAISTRSRGFQRTWLLTIAILGGASRPRAGGAFLTRHGVTPSFKQVFRHLARFPTVSAPVQLWEWRRSGHRGVRAHSVDGSVTRSISDPNPLRETFKTGALIGGTPFELGAAFGTYAIGRALNKPCRRSVGADLVQAQLMAQALTLGLKQATGVQDRRARVFVPIGSRHGGLRICHRASAALRLEGRRSGVCRRVICRCVAR